MLYLADIKDWLKSFNIAEHYYTGNISDEAKYIINNVIEEYGAFATWKLSELSHKEKSWINARIGLDPSENGNKELDLEDIREDSKKVRPYDHVWDMYYDEFDDVEKIIE